MILAFILLLVASGSCFSQSGASYTAQRRLDNIVVDGILNEATWATASNTLPFTVWDGTPAPAALQTTAKMVWDDNYLYVAFSCKDPDVYATYVGRDVHCWEQDNFEIFVTVPGTTGYIEAEGSPKNAIWDGYFTNVFQGPQGSYTITNLQVGAQVDGTINNSSGQDTGFTAEMRVPFSDIYQGIAPGHPVNGTQLRLNLNRINWNTPAVQGGPGASGTDTYYAWSPVPGSGVSFHRPDKFGTVTFSTNTVPTPIWKFTGETIDGPSLILSGIGHPGGTYVMMVSSDLSIPTPDWVPVATNKFDSVTGQFIFTNTVASLSLFFRLVSP